MRLNNQQREEVDKIAANAPNGLLEPDMIVSAARDEKSALHSLFDWNLESAALEHWRDKARQIIRVCVTKIDSAPQPVRAFMSLPTDRINGGGYRSTESVARNPIQRSQLIEEAIKEIERAARRFEFMDELKPLFNDVLAVTNKHRAAFAAPNALAG